MLGLEGQIAHAEKKFGKDHKLVQMLRSQLRTQGTSAQEMYLTGSVPKTSYRSTTGKPERNSRKGGQ